MIDTIEPPAPRIAVPERLDPGLLDGFDRTAALVCWRGETMGTSWSVQAALPAHMDATAVRMQIIAVLNRIVAEMSHWEPGSLLSAYNRSAPGCWINLPPDFAAVMTAAFEVAQQSGGAFDPAIGRLTDLWGLGPRPPGALPEPPAPDALAAALAASGWRRIAMDRGITARLHQPGGIWLDLSGIAKGHGADAVDDMLANLGIQHALVEIGGECAGRGIRPDGEPWWVDMETPPGLTLPPLRIALHQLSVATSGDYLRGAHAIDPATGMPAIHDTTAVSVVHARCALADAWASALSIMPPDRAQQVAELENLAARFISRKGAEWLSPALARML